MYGPAESRRAMRKPNQTRHTAVSTAPAAGTARRPLVGRLAGPAGGWEQAMGPGRRGIPLSESVQNGTSSETAMRDNAKHSWKGQYRLGRGGSGSRRPSRPPRQQPPSPLADV